MFENAPENLPVDDMFDKVDPAPGGPATGASAAPRPAAPGGPAVGAPRPSPLKPVQRAATPAPKELAALEEPGMGYQRILLFVGIGVVVVGVIGAAAYLTLRRVGTPAANAPVVNTPAANVNVNVPPANTNVNVPPANTNVNVPVITPPPAPPSQGGGETNANANANSNVNAPGPIIIDSDGDGLTDAEERSLGTDPTKTDTDGDELSDWDEVRVYRTNPLNADTDGDTYFDGAEVRNGYDPNGPGRLLPPTPGSSTTTVTP